MKLYFLISLILSTLCSTVFAVSISFFDSHVHLNDLPMQNELMTQTGLNKAVIFWGGRSDNADVLAAAQQQKGKFFPFVSVSPERLDPYGKWWKNNDSELLRYLEKQLESKQFYGIGELSVVHFPSPGFPETEFSPISPLMTGIMKIAEKFRLPVMLHSEVTYVKEFEQLLKQFPAVLVIWAHGGYADYYITKRMLDSNQNLIVELSMRALENHPRSPDYWILKNSTTIWDKWRQLIETNPRRFIVGSDASHHNLKSDLAKVESVKLLLSQLPQSLQSCVAETNLEVILSLREYQNSECLAAPVAKVNQKPVR